MLQQFLPAHGIIKIPGIQRINCNPQFLFHRIQIHTAHIKSLIADDLRWREFINLIHQPAAVRKFRHKIISCRNICNGHSVPVCNIDNAHNIIILRLIQCLRIQVRSRSYDPHDLTLYDSLRLLWIFHLLTDCHFVSFGNQPVQISFHRMIRDSAHWGTFFLPTVFPGQCDLQFSGCSQCILKEHFIKIA